MAIPTQARSQGGSLGAEEAPFLSTILLKRSTILFKSYNFVKKYPLFCKKGPLFCHIGPHFVQKNLPVEVSGYGLSTYILEKYLGAVLHA